jgi:hypothetical protein
MLPNLTDQFIADTYKGILHTSNTPISSVDIPVFDGVGNRTALNIGASGASITIDGTVKADKFTVKGYNSIIDYLYPLNSIYLSFDNTNPSTRFIGTAWEQVASGKFLVGVGTGTDSNNVGKAFGAGENAGEYAVTLTTNQIPAHNHLHGVRTQFGADANIYGNTATDTELAAGSVDTDSGLGGQAAARQGFTSNTGGGQSHNNTPPSFGLYVWRRIV